jgi:hypothetical protein
MTLFSMKSQTLNKHHENHDVVRSIIKHYHYANP